MRFVINLLAIFCGLICLVIAGVCLLLMVSLSLGSSARGMSAEGMAVALVALAGFALLSLYAVFRMIVHLRWPTPETARQVIVCTGFLLVVELIALLRGRSEDETDQLLPAGQDVVGGPGAGAALVLLYRFALKGLVARSYTPNDPS